MYTAKRTISARRVGSGRGGIPTPSRIAASGGTLVARSAGGRPARTVTPMPTISETTIVRVSSTVPLSGRSAPKALNSPSSAGARRIPPNNPITAPMTPSSRPSSTTERMICAREAPSVRSRPNSRVRWATVMEKVLKMMNAPTTSAT